MDSCPFQCGWTDVLKRQKGRTRENLFILTNSKLSISSLAFGLSHKLKHYWLPWVSSLLTVGFGSSHLPQLHDKILYNKAGHVVDTSPYTQLDLFSTEKVSSMPLLFYLRGLSILWYIITYSKMAFSYSGTITNPG